MNGRVTDGNWGYFTPISGVRSLLRISYNWLGAPLCTSPGMIHQLPRGSPIPQLARIQTIATNYHHLLPSY